ncbi:hypothetical protein [Caminibacter pacificus]|uniref:Uncharacterized protein n=1 Tax=Caminibacter pacificus TaxID=1424653 RepID=A0AAJ4RCX0_9BACT|nr:hypothetical protein [Caminibacter pacificus]QCI27606.1 hypothetical protein C6V80_01100 [Caminibacter pacificus]ROR40215.1 hypothetical protein EDC58_1203 [Caminibacter pacificus]
MQEITIGENNYTIRVIANRQLCGWAGSDKYINVTNSKVFQKLWEKAKNGKITKINGSDIKIENKGGSSKVSCSIIDVVKGKTYESKSIYLTLREQPNNELRFQLTSYVNDNNIMPRDIIEIFIIFDNQNCHIKIKIDYFFKYILEKYPKKPEENLYRILIDNSPNGHDYINENFLNNFNISKTNEKGKFGNSKTEFTLFEVQGCGKQYIGVPYDGKLQLHCFDKLEEIL